MPVYPTDTCFTFKLMLEKPICLTAYLWPKIEYACNSLTLQSNKHWWHLLYFLPNLVLFNLHLTTFRYFLNATKIEKLPIDDKNRIMVRLAGCTRKWVVLHPYTIATFNILWISCSYEMRIRTRLNKHSTENSPMVEVYSLIYLT